MSGLTGLIDALLAVRAAPRLDVPGIKAEARIDAPGAPAPVPVADNDVRLPSKAALERLLPGAPASSPPGSPPAAPEAELSPAARLISAVLADLEADIGPVRGSAPAWPARQAPSAAALAGTLAQTLAHSGLFYESHLVGFASGSRSLAQLLQEPQARWATPPAVQRSAETAAPAVAMPAGVDAEAPAVAQPVDGPARQPGGAAAAPAAAAGSPPLLAPADVIHPQVIGLVHQQLDLLATSMFRWTGEAWPGVAMQWSVQKEDEPQAHGDDAGSGTGEPHAQCWSTVVCMSLPRLGQVDLRLSLAGDGVQARLAGGPETAAALRADSGTLVRRLEAAGLRMQALQVVVAAATGETA